MIQDGLEMAHVTYSVRRGMEGTSADVHEVFPPRKHQLVRGHANGILAQDVTPIVEPPRGFFVYHTTVCLAVSYRFELL